MRLLYLVLFFFLVSGCAAQYVGPTSGPVATATFQLANGLVDGPTVSMFDGLDCEPSEYGEYIGTLWDGNWTEPSTLAFTVNIPAGRVISFEFFDRLVFTGEVVREGQFCRQLFAFEPSEGEHYIFTYGECDYSAVVESSGQPLETVEPTGKCHSGKWVGAY